MARNKPARKYGSAADRTRAAAEQAGPAGSGGTMFKNLGDNREFFNPDVPKGKTEIKYTMRFLPYVVTDKRHPDGPTIAPAGELWYKRPFKRYRQIGVNKKSYISPLSVGKPCPIHEYFTRAKADPSIPEAEANKFKAQDMVAYNIQILDEKTKEWSDPLFWFFSYACFEKRLKKELLDPDNEEYASFMDLEGGYDLRVRFQKENFAGNDFLTADSISFIEREDIDESILDEVVNLDECLVIKEYDELNNIFLEIGEDNDEHQEPEKKEEKKERMAKDQPTRQRKSARPEPPPEELPEDEGTGDDVPLELNCPNNWKFGEDFDSQRRCTRCAIRIECGEAFDEADPSFEPEKKEKKSERRSRTNKESLGDCPHGHEFAVDCDTNKDCDVCNVWDSCMDAQEKLKKK